MNLPIINVGVVGIIFIAHPQNETISLIIKYFLRPSRSDAPPVRAPNIAPMGTSVVAIVTSNNESSPQPSQLTTASWEILNDPY